MNKWHTIQNWSKDICEVDTITQMQRQSGRKEFNIAQGMMIASSALRLYERGGKDFMIDHISKELKNRMPGSRQSSGFTVDEKRRVEDILKHQFKYHWFPFSRIQFNMRRLTK